jgi:antitoxin component YwqK of YwqJK toxin-antitoxin module
VKKILLIILFISVGFSQQKWNIKSMYEYDGLMYSPTSDKPYTGSVFSLDSLGTKKEEGKYRNGLKDGRWIYYTNVGNGKYEVTYKAGIYTVAVFTDNLGTNYTGLPTTGTYESEQDGIFLFQRQRYRDEYDFLIYPMHFGTIKDGKQDGKWTWWNEDGGIDITGSYKNGLMNGMWKYYYENGKIRLQGSYTNGDGSYVDNFPDSLKIEYPSFDGRKGKWIAWHSNGVKDYEITYKDGKLDGLFTEWHENGQKKSEKNYKDGDLIDGKWTFWYENGQLKEKRFYKLTDEGYRTNIGTIWYPNGRERQSTFYIGKERVISLWYKNGIMQSQTWDDIANNSAYSYEIHFNKDGKIDYEAIYWASLADVMYRGYEDGNLIDKEWFGNCYENEFAYDLNGVYVGSGEEVKCPEELFRVWQGTWTIRDNNDNKKIERIYKDGELVEKICWNELGNECECGEYWWEGCK